MAEGLIQERPCGINRGKSCAEAGNNASHSLQGRRKLCPMLGTFALKHAKKHKVIY